MLSKITAIFLLLLLSPFFIIVSIIILIDDGFPIFFRQDRYGIHLKKFKIYKFRTMRNDTPDVATHLLKSSENALIRSGKILRLLSMDEFPQLFNIIKGEMVFFGPRPALHNQFDLIEMRENYGINNLTPGLTGWAQVNGRDLISLKQKVELDSYYLKNKSISLNVKIFFKTLKNLLLIKGVSH